MRRKLHPYSERWKPKSSTELKLQRGGPLPHPTWLGSFKIWNARSIIASQTKKRENEAMGGSWFASDLVGCVFGVVVGWPRV